MAAMTMGDDLCDVCRTNPPIGVASTSIPLSVAYCAQCARLGADPEGVFEYWAEECKIKPNEHRAPDQCVTFRDGKYVTYRQWYEARHTNEQ
jgi:hypothetical protein